MKTIFSKPSASDIATMELDRARIEILGHHSAAEYHDAMIACLTARIERLESSVHLRITEFMPESTKS